MTSTFGKSATLTGLSGFVTNGFVRTTLPVGDVNRKIDHDSHSILTGPVWASPSVGHPTSAMAMIPPIIHPSRPFAMIPLLPST